MKRILVKTLIATSIAFLSFASFAEDNMSTDATNTSATKPMMSEKMMMKMKWMCETNASSSNMPGDQKADDEMKNKMKSAKDAFAFALKHCRDCTKITCTMENKQ